MWDCIHETEQMMSSTVNTLKEKDAVSVRLLKQMARELFLLQASDWEFLVSTGAAKDYAEERFRTHYADFKTLGGMLDLYLKEGALPGVMIDTLSRCEERDAVFDNVKIEWFEERTQNGLQTHP
jgi:1,4-alpha-glucan branching enzyme